MRSSEPTARGDGLARAVVELADTLVSDFDVITSLQALCAHCVELFGPACVSVVLQDPHDALHVVASSDEQSRVLELMELASREGPCLDAYRRRVLVRSTSADAELRWPLFAREAAALGLQTFVAVPMRLREEVMGALSMFGPQEWAMERSELRDAQALADVATIGLLHERAVREAHVLADQLQHALTSRIVIEQAKGVVATVLGIHVDGAFSVIRRYARHHNLRLHDVAAEIVGRSLPVSRLLTGGGPARVVREPGRAPGR